MVHIPFAISTNHIFPFTNAQRTNMALFFLIRLDDGFIYFTRKIKPMHGAKIGKSDEMKEQEREQEQGNKRTKEQGNKGTI